IRHRPHPAHSVRRDAAQAPGECAGAWGARLAEDAAPDARLHLPDPMGHPPRPRGSARHALAEGRLTDAWQGGQSSVEFGASAIVLFLLLFGLIDLGRVFY